MRVLSVVGRCSKQGRFRSTEFKSGDLHRAKGGLDRVNMYILYHGDMFWGFRQTLCASSPKYCLGLDYVQSEEDLKPPKA